MNTGMQAIAKLVHVCMYVCMYVCMHTIQSCVPFMADVERQAGYEGRGMLAYVCMCLYAHL
jgi:hypothetical protein